MTVKEIISKYGNKRENLLQILHDIQNQNSQNYIDEEDINLLSEEMNIPISDIKGTASFYTMYSFVPRGKYIIRVCDSPPCHILGAQTIFDALEKKLGIKEGEITKDGLFTLEGTSCLGVCGVAPAMMINDEVYGNLDEEKIEKILEQIREKESK
ncbi:MAG: NADH-quinone oxidoreductase subunit E [Actinobacteria bacterium RBG_13_35_12]|uniref:NADH-quinone oxidoreductase subunit E n=1 Tax=Candidatus Sediminicultor quintus TaxID=1797291 RepID=A0A1F5ABT3_9BACT|nr:MAG: NADH-quinone oxidoreductase subunit E [Actinobacteria bacterium RBG_13_35_12]OGD15828.1 MAG: NADH-quinone oxidoreductase subunit E [Candidatus Atribacteria bacterium RBG_19FT_COMBO_35_14]OGD31167.1 MAG: NADH-quinone oxidoreductase subunit E [Candidatus Atribacteria bacterium RBG_16_35_8]